VVGDAGVGAFDADAIATQFLGDSIYTNPVMLGYAWQKGWIPLQLVSLTRAMELNAVAVDNNKAAFAWGRQAALDWPGVQKLLNPGQVITFTPRHTHSVDELVAKRVEFLTGYQNAAYAASYASFVDSVRRAESAMAPTAESAKREDLPLTQAVARYLFKLMAYKDEYEVARLHTDTAFAQQIAAMFEGEIRLQHHLAPPLLAKTDEKGELVKQVYGPWMHGAMKLLARLKGLRGGALDIFGRTPERREERALIGEYEDTIRELLKTLNARNLAQAAQIARLPEEIRGYGHVKARHLQAVRPQWQALMQAWRSGAGLQKAA
jgi:indolepyruvate ferredoxin oxidoreductase